MFDFTIIQVSETMTLFHMPSLKMDDHKAFQTIKDYDPLVTINDCDIFRMINDYGVFRTINGCDIFR
jgi:hypothetical protein